MQAISNNINNMKSLKYPFVLSFLMIFCFGMMLYAENPISKHDKGIDIPISGACPIDTTRRRSPELIPMRAVCYTEVPIVVISFVRNIGEVEIELFNYSSGEFVSDIVSSKDGGIMIPFSGTVGHYRILFTTDNGRDYIGEFDIE